MALSRIEHNGKTFTRGDLVYLDYTDKEIPPINFLLEIDEKVYNQRVMEVWAIDTSWSKPLILLHSTTNDSFERIYAYIDSIYKP